MLGVKFKGFFDRPAVLKRVRDGTRSALSKAGAYVRTRARSSLRRRARVAAAGSPPSDHGGYLKRLLFFAYDRARHSVVIGPMLFRQQRPTGPQLLEEGGAIVSPRAQWMRPAAGDEWALVPAGTTYRYRGHPFMAPALEAERPKFPSLFTNSIR